MPADTGGGSAVEAGAPEFIDLLCSQNPDLMGIYADGLQWLDAATGAPTTGRSSTRAPPGAAQQTAMLDALVAAERDEPVRLRICGMAWILQLDPPDDGRRYYTSPIGIADVGFAGNRVLAA